MADVVLDRVEPEGIDNGPGKIITVVAAQETHRSLYKIDLTAKKQAPSAVLHHQHEHQQEDHRELGGPAPRCPGPARRRSNASENMQRDKHRH